MRIHRDQPSFRLFYRISQFWNALKPPQIKQKDLVTIKSILTEDQLKIFLRLQPSEIHHSLAVLKTLNDKGEFNPNLHEAALLHDIGKIVHPLNVWERIIIVLTKRFFPKLIEDLGRGNPIGWRRSFVIAKQHPDWGSQLAIQAGTNPTVCYLIREHQDHISSHQKDLHENKLLAALQAADRVN